jgi:2-polyprenyl-3-methyl-5-hydroxy-6-metoxy-1,4-benzoquinol methylase/GNAT superfamily N-acetyltransferase
MSGFSVDDARESWNRGADAWDEFVESGKDYYRLEVHGPTLLEACGDVRGLEALDLGCGQGYFARGLARRGARVTALDVAEKQVENARRHDAAAPLGIEYLVLDAALIAGRFAAGSFDIVTGCMSLHDMPDPGAVLRAAFGVLRPGGRMVYSIPHPLTEPPCGEWERAPDGTKLALKVKDYFEPTALVCRWNMARLKYHWTTPCRHYTLGQVSAMVVQAGFVIRQLTEPRPTSDQVARRPELDDCFRLPYYLVVDLAKPTGVTISRMTEPDIAAIAKAFERWHKTVKQYEGYFAEQQRGERVVLVAKLAGDVVGYGTLLSLSGYAPFREQGIPEIADLNVIREYQHKGIGSALVYAAERLARACGCAAIGIAVEQSPDYESANRLYPHLGFEPDGRGITTHDNELHLTKPLR